MTSRRPWQPARAELARLAREEFGAWPIRVTLFTVVAKILPRNVGGRLRAALMRLAGFDVGPGAMFAGVPRIMGPRSQRFLHIGKRSWFNTGCTLDVHADVFIGENVRVGHEVMILTHTHEIGPPVHRAGPLVASPVRVGDGAWLGARA